MTQSIESVTTAALSAALQAGTARQAAIASNIANAGTEGYVPLRLSFGEHLAQARASLADRGRLDAASIDGLRGELEPLLDDGGLPAKVQLDVEMTELARNAVQFQALTQALSRHLSLQAMAASDGRR
jgi:flagellar basal-body rod protein FlgB